MRLIVLAIIGFVAYKAMYSSDRPEWYDDVMIIAFRADNVKSAPAAGSEARILWDSCASAAGTYGLPVYWVYEFVRSNKLSDCELSAKALYQAALSVGRPVDTKLETLTTFKAKVYSLALAKSA